MPARMKFGIGLLFTAVFLSSAPPQSLPDATTPSQQNAPQPAATQDSQADTEIGQLSSVVLKVTTKMVLVDAVVTGKDGKPVAGLKADDFEIFEDGSRQQIRAFGASVPPQPGAAPAHRKLPPGTFTNTLDFHPEEGPAVILLFDALNTPWADQVYGRTQLVDYLKKNLPQRNVAVYALGRRLRLLQDFTSDAEAVQQAVSGAPSQTHDSRGPTETQLDFGPMVLSEAPPTAAASTPGQLLAQVMQQLSAAQELINKFEQDNATATTLDAFRTIARHAAAIPGRKQLVWLSAGFPLNFDVLANSPYFMQYRETADLLTDAQVAVYPVDIRGLVAFDPATMAAGMERLRSNHLAMNYVASRTGGFAFYERNDVDQAIANAVNDGANYYSLGYYPANRNWNGEFRTIKVKVRRPGLNVRCRSGYFSTDPAQRNEKERQHGRAEFLEAVARDAGGAAMLPFFAQVVPPDNRHSQLFVDVRVDPHSVLFTPQANGMQKARIEFITLALDASNKIVTSKFDTLNTNLTPRTFAEVMKTSLAVRQKLDLPPGSYKLRVGVRDANTNLMGTLTAQVEITESSH